MSVFKVIGVLLLVAIASLPVAHANTGSVSAAGAAQSAEETVRLHFSALSLGDYLSGIRYVSMGEVRELAVNNGSRSSRQLYVGPPVINFFREHIGADGVAVREPVGSVDVRNRKGPLLLLFDDGRLGVAADEPAVSGARPHVRIFAMEDGLDGFPGGSYRMLNMTADPLAVSVAGDVVNVAAYSVATTDARPGNGRAERGRNSLDVVIGRFNRSESVWVRIYESKWPSSSTQRTLVLLYPDAKRPDGIGVRRIAQMLELPAALLPTAAIVPER